MTHRHVGALVSLLLLAPLAGCSHYYMVQDPGGSKTYYTDKIDHKLGGAIVFKDLQTGAKVTLQNSSVKDINKAELPSGTVK